MMVGSMRLRKKLIGLLLVCALILIDTGFGTMRSVAVLAKINGNLDINEVLNPGWKIANLGQMLYNGDRLRSGSESWAAIFFLDGSQIKIHENSQFTIQSEREKERALKTTVKVAQGEMWMKVPKKGSEFRIETPTSVASVKGTEFNLLVERDGTTYLTVIEGSVEFLNEMGRVLATEMTSCMAAQNQAPSAPEKISRRDVPSWEREVKQDYKLSLSLAVPGEKETNRPFNIDVEVRDVRRNQRAVSYNAGVHITSDGEDIAFSADGGQSWQTEVDLSMVKGKAVVKCKSLVPGEQSILAAGPDCAPGKVTAGFKMSERKVDLMKNRATQVISRIEDEELGEKLAGKTFKGAQVSRGVGDVSTVLDGIESGSYQVMEKTVIEEPDGGVKVILRVRQQSGQ